MIPPANQIATRGILNNNSVVLPAAGWLILAVSVAPVVTKRHGGIVGLPLGYPEPKTEDKKYYIKVTFQLNEHTYTDIKYINKNINIKSEDIEIEIVDDKPIVKIKFEEDVDVEETKISKN